MGVTPSTRLIASRVQPSSATICSFVMAVRGCGDQTVSAVAYVRKRVWTYVVGPCVHGDFVASHVLIDEDVRVRHHTRADDEERRRKVVILQILQHLSVSVQGLVLSWRQRSNPRYHLRCCEGESVSMGTRSWRQ